MKLRKIVTSIFILLSAGLLLSACSASRRSGAYNVVGYYSGDSLSLLRYDLTKLTHLIYGFGHVDSGNFVVNRYKDSATLRAFTTLKKQNPGLKTMIALGGWGGCRPCSQTFSDSLLTRKFAASVGNFLNQFELDGIDLDWEYPVIPGPPGHAYQPSDREHFTRLVRELRGVLGDKKLITFAAGGFQRYLDSSIAWGNVEPYIDFVNLMTYDLVHGYSTETGHHTNLYSATRSGESIDNAIRFFRTNTFPLKKLMVGAGFYAREFGDVSQVNNGLFQEGRFLRMVDYTTTIDKYTSQNGYKYHWDRKAKSPYWYNREQQIFVTGENKRSVKLKCRYIRKHHLGGLMYWEIKTDNPNHGLYEAIKL